MGNLFYIFGQFSPGMFFIKYFFKTIIYSFIQSLDPFWKEELSNGKGVHLSRKRPDYLSNFIVLWSRTCNLFSLSIGFNCWWCWWWWQCMNWKDFWAAHEIMPEKCSAESPVSVLNSHCYHRRPKSLSPFLTTPSSFLSAFILNFRVFPLHI